MKSDRIEDLVPLWRAHFAAKLADLEVGRVQQEVEGALAEKVNTGDRDLVGRIGQAVSDAVARRVRESLLPACLRWVCEQDHCGPEFSEVRALNEVRGAFRNVAPVVPGLRAPATTVRHQAWALPAGVGAALGAAAMLPLMAVLPRLDILPMFAGGILGAAGVVWLIGCVASSPRIVAGLETGKNWGGVVWVPVMFWRGLRGRPIGWVGAAVSTLGAWLVLATVRPRVLLPSRGEVLADLEGPIRGLLAHEADMALALCWSHTSRLGRPEVSTTAPALGGPILRAIRDARATVRGPSATREDLADAVEALLQRLEDEEYQWVDVDPGTPYTASIEPYFQKFGKIDIGQPVEMHLPALVRHEVVVEPGMLRRVRT